MVRSQNSATSPGSPFKFRTDPFTLKFQSPQKELGYAASGADASAWYLRWGSMLVLLWSAVFVIRSFINIKEPQMLRTFRWTVWAIQTVICVGNIVMTCLPSVPSRFGPCVWERIVVFESYFVILPVMFAYLLGYDPSVDFQTDAFQVNSLLLLLISLAFSLLVHHVICVRWWMIWPYDVLCITYALISQFLGSPEHIQVPVVFGVCQLLLTLSHRRVEMRHREMFALLADERVQRVQTELRLEQQQQLSSSVSECATEASSIPCPDSDGFLEELVAVGRKEQWLIPVDEVQLISEHVLGMGGFGIVVSGTFHGTPVAVKIPTRQGGGIPSSLNELRVLRKIRHPNLVIFQGACVDVVKKDILLVLEHVRGETLDAYVEVNVSGSDSDIAKGNKHVLVGLCRALLYLHTRTPGVVHGDLKPGNIFVEHARFAPNAKLIDFGLSRVLKSGVKALGGTILWAAPEVLPNFEKGLVGKQSSERPTTASDVFSLGRVLFLVFTGRMPLFSVDSATIIHLAKEKQVPRLDWPQATLGQYRNISELCMHISPSDRPSMQAVLRSISELVVEKTPIACSQSSPGGKTQHGGEGDGQSEVAMGAEEMTNTSASLWQVVASLRCQHANPHGLGGSSLAFFRKLQRKNVALKQKGKGKVIGKETAASAVDAAAAAAAAATPTAGSSVPPVPTATPSHAIPTVAVRQPPAPFGVIKL